jgi:ribosomal protein S27E
MGVYYCIKCGKMMVDPDLYNRVDKVNQRNKKANLDTQINCFSCGTIQTLRQMGDKKIAEHI